MLALWRMRFRDQTAICDWTRKKSRNLNPGLTTSVISSPCERWDSHLHKFCLHPRCVLNLRYEVSIDFDKFHFTEIIRKTKIMGLGSTVPFLNRRTTDAWPCLLASDLYLHIEISLMIVSSKSLSSFSGIPSIPNLYFLVYCSRSSSFVSRSLIC